MVGQTPVDDLTVSWHGDGLAYVSNWGSDEQEFSLQLLEQADPRWLTVDGDKVTIHAANGRRTYVRMYQIGDPPGAAANPRSLKYRATGPVETEYGQ